MTFVRNVIDAHQLSAAEEISAAEEEEEKGKNTTMHRNKKNQKGLPN